MAFCYHLIEIAMDSVSLCFTTELQIREHVLSITLKGDIHPKIMYGFTLQELASDVEADCQLLGGKSQALQEEASLMHHIMSRLRRYQDERLETTGLKWKLPPGGQPICLFSALSNPSKNNRPIIRTNDDSKRDVNYELETSTSFGVLYDRDRLPSK